MGYVFRFLGRHAIALHALGFIASIYAACDFSAACIHSDVWFVVLLPLWAALLDILIYFQIEYEVDNSCDVSFFAFARRHGARLLRGFLLDYAGVANRERRRQRRIIVAKEALALSALPVAVAFFPLVDRLYESAVLNVKTAVMYYALLYYGLK